MDGVTAIHPAHEAAHGRSGPSTLGPSAPRTLAAIAVVAAVVMTAAGCRPPRCTQPYPAAMWEQFHSTPEPWPYGGTDRSRPPPMFDSDADGVEDTVDGATGSVVPSVVVHRGRGDLTFTAEHGVAAPTGQAGSDHDGDGRSEILVGIADQSGNVEATYVVPGSTPDGSHHPADVGILVSLWLPAIEQRIGDFDGDGADDLAFPLPSSVNLLTGRDLMAPGPGGAFDGQVRQISGRLVGTVPITTALDAMVLVETLNEVTLWLNGATLRFTTANSGFGFTPDIGHLLFARVVDGPGDDVWLHVGRNRERPGIGDRWAWDLDAPCGEPAVPPLADDGRPATR